MVDQPPINSGFTGAKNLEIVYSNLLKLYDLTLDRKKSLTAQATSLLSFTGIIQTVFVGLLVTVLTDSAKRQMLLTVPYHEIIIDLIGLGFLLFTLTIILAFLSFFEWKWIPAPVVSGDTNVDNWRSKLVGYVDKSDAIPILGYELQLLEGVKFTNNVNKFKYNTLVASYSFFVASFVVLALVGFFIIAGIV